MRQKILILQLILVFAICSFTHSANVYWVSEFQLQNYLMHLNVTQKSLSRHSVIMWDLEILAIKPLYYPSVVAASPPQLNLSSKEPRDPDHGVHRKLTSSFCEHLSPHTGRTAKHSGPQ